MSDFSPKRSLGQNFFTNETLAKKILTYVTASDPKTVMEIGPGRGSFTQLLYKLNTPLVCVEKDDELARLIQQVFPRSKVLQEDILTLNINKLSDPELLGEIRPRICFGSLPYNISKKIIRLLLESKMFDELFFIIQKEVAEKYVEKDGKSNILSVTSQIYAEAKIVLNIPPQAFTPQPKVTSSFIHFHPKMPASYSEEPTKEQVKSLERVISLAFTSPRKTLHNNLSKFYQNLSEEYKTKRAEQLSFADFAILSKSLNEKI